MLRKGFSVQVDHGREVPADLATKQICTTMVWMFCLSEHLLKAKCTTKLGSEELSLNSGNQNREITRVEVCGY
jgi:hypothetical protein